MFAGTDYHVHGQGFTNQTSGQISGTAGPISILNERSYSIPPILNPNIPPGVPQNIPTQSTASPNIQSQSQISSLHTSSGHNSSSEMNKQSHLPSQSSPMQPIFVPSQSRSSSQV